MNSITSPQDPDDSWPTLLAVERPSSRLEDRLSLVSRVLDALPQEPELPTLVHDCSPVPRLISLRDTVTVIGRASGCDYVEPSGEDRTMSGRHFSVCLRPEGMWLEDLSSTNGTWLDTKRIDAGWLRAGDIVRAGKQRFVFIDPR